MYNNHHQHEPQSGAFVSFSEISLAKKNSDRIKRSGFETDSSSFTDKLINWLESRRSVVKLIEPAPSQEQLLDAIHCAMTAPDHKKLKPWRFIVTAGDARLSLAEALLASAIAQAQRAGELVDEKTRCKTLNMPLRAPVIITVVTQMRYHEKVPHFEQMLSAGACIQNLILALQAQGFASVWRTGLLANEAEIKRYFNVGAEDYIAGFIYVGTPASPVPTRQKLSVDEYVTFDM